MPGRSQAFARSISQSLTAATATLLFQLFPDELLMEFLEFSCTGEIAPFFTADGLEFLQVLFLELFRAFNILGRCSEFLGVVDFQLITLDFGKVGPDPFGL